MSDVLLFGLTLHNMIALAVIVYTIWAFTASFARKRSKELDAWLQQRSLDKLVPDEIKWYFMFGFAVACVFLYLYCWLCQFYGIDGPGDDRFFLDWMFRDLLGILPWFVWGCILAGFINKYMYLGKLRLPKSMVGAGLFASVIPVCSCAAVPIAHGMMLGKQMRVRAIITFLIIVPVLSPVVYVLAISQIGIVYLITEIIAVFALAFALGIIIEKYAGVKDEKDPKAGCFTCEGCNTSHMLKHRSSALLSSWDQFHYLLKFIFMGIIIGSFFATMVDPDALSSFFGTQGDLLSGLPGLIIIVCIAIPLYICSGTDVIILAPLLMASGGPLIPLGHAIAFAIAGNAICITSAPVLLATFGKKVTAMIFGGFFVGAIALGIIINALNGLIGFF